MAANEVLVGRYEKALSEIREKQKGISDAFEGLLTKAREEEWLKGLGMPEEAISEMRSGYEPALNSKTPGIRQNETNLWAMQLEMYKDICDQLSEIKEMLGK